MTQTDGQKGDPRPLRVWTMVWTGVGLMTLVWVLDSLVDTFVFHHDSLMQSLLAPGPFELWMRSVVVLILAYAVYMHRAFTVQKGVETTLREGETRFRQVVEASPIPMVMVNQAGRIVMTNLLTDTLFAYSREELMGEPVELLIPQRLRSDHEAHWRDFFREPRTRAMGKQQALYGRRKDGSEFPAEIGLNHLTIGEETFAVSTIVDITERKQTENMIRAVAEGVSAETGDAFFRSLVSHLGRTLEVAYAFVGELTPNKEDHVATVAVYCKGTIVENFDYALAGTPCAEVIGQYPCTHPSGVQQRFPLDTLLADMGVESYMGCPLNDAAGRARGIMVVMDTKPLSDAQRMESVFKIFATRAAAELERKRAEEALRRAHDELEVRVRERTASLTEANRKLECEMAERRLVLVALQESVQEFRALSESLPIGVFEVDGAGTCLYKNHAWEQIFGVATLDDSTGNWLSWFHPDDRTALEQAWQDSKTWYSRIIQDCRIAAANGIERWTQLQLSPMIDDQGARYLGTIEDITERKRAESALLQLIRHNHMILSSAEEGIYGLDVEGKTTFMNPAAARMLGYEPEELIGKPQHALSHHSKPDGSPYPRKGCPIYAAFTDGTVHHVETEVFWRRDGTSFPVEYTSTPIRDEHDHLIGAVVTFHDITERKRAEEQLTEAYARLQQLTIQLAAAEEEERKRIARELHDEFGQILAGMKFDLAWLGKQLNGKAAASRPAVRDKVRAMSALVDTTIQTVQRISAALRPSILDDLGLAAAVEWLGQGFQTRTGCCCEVTVSPRITEMAIKAERGLALFRIAQELLTNVMRHAQASRVRLSLTEKGGDLILNVEDNGRGIAEAGLASPNSLGLKGIRERLSLVGGGVSIQGKRGKGTTVRVGVPAG